MASMTTHTEHKGEPMTDASDSYWIECIADAAEECGAILTTDQCREIARSVRFAHENYRMAFGPVDSPLPGEIRRLERELSVEKSKRGCPTCRGRGRINYSMGTFYSSGPCDTCHGEGKILT